MLFTPTRNSPEKIEQELFELRSSAWNKARRLQCFSNRVRCISCWLERHNFFILGVLQKKFTRIVFVHTGISPENLNSIGQEFLGPYRTLRLQYFVFTDGCKKFLSKTQWLFSHKVFCQENSQKRLACSYASFLKIWGKTSN